MEAGKPMRRDIFLYLAGPLTARNDYTVEDNVQEAIRWYRRCLLLGFPSFLPHFSVHVPGAFDSIPYELWLEYDFAVIARCTHLLHLPRWETSPGARREVEYAYSIDVPVIDPCDLVTL